MNKKKILRFLLGASIVSSVFSLGSMKTFAAWENENNSWKYIENNGYVTGWNKYNDNWYYFNSDGVMQTGWIKDNGTWYYLNQSGDMRTGWIKDNGAWYYLNQSGNMQTGWLKDKGTWYYLNQSGEMQTGWVNDKGTWYYLNSNGAMQTGVISVADKVYYLNESGAMQTGKVIIDGQEYEFNSNGEAVGNIPNVEKEKVFGFNIDKIQHEVEDNTTDNNSSSSTNKKHHSSSSSNITSPQVEKKWNLVWEDDFSGDELNKEYWNYETHEPGWVNNELQEYTDSKDNIFVKDGNLVLKAIKTEKDGKEYYTSGKVTTQNKKTFKYGKFEIKAKTPKGQGLWPALWMMPNDENLYGQWPKCGEIDIMEVLGHEPEKAYGTIHYGDPHEEKQGTYTLENGSFADEYHVYGLEWEPSEMRFYIDGNLYHTVKDWFTKVEGGDEKTFPAPFDQPFYLQCNLAVGGNWPGNPDETTDFDNAELKVDYIKVYQLDNYDENVKKPDPEKVVLRDPDEKGNYIINGDFSKEDKSWEFMTAIGGVGSSEIKDNKMIIKTENAGTVDYSIQLVQPRIPVKEGGKYKVTFDAKAAEDRTMIVDISAPDRGYKRYFNDTKVDLTTEKKSYSYEFVMENSDDANGRLEFNLGNQGSTADVEISNVRIEKIGEVEKTEDEFKKVSPDGNYINNGTFDVGQDRMKYWEVKSKSNNTQVSVTNDNNSRQLKVSVGDNSSELEEVSVKQTKLALSENTQYVLYFDAYSEDNKNIRASIDENDFDVELTNKKKTYKFTFETKDEINNRDLELLLGKQGTVYIDNVRIEENSLIRNGSFDNGFAGWEVFADSSVSSDVSSGIDSFNGNKNAAEINIDNTGDADWKIQLKQTNVKLVQGKKYRISFDAKSTIDRDIMYAIQRDGSKDDNWDAYTGSNTISIGNESQLVSYEFEMKKDTDEDAIFTISMGAVNNNQIKEKHKVTIDNVKLEEIDEFSGNVDNENTDEKPEGTENIRNGSLEVVDESDKDSIDKEPSENIADTQNNSSELTDSVEKEETTTGDVDDKSEEDNKIDTEEPAINDSENQVANSDNEEDEDSEGEIADTKENSKEADEEPVVVDDIIGKVEEQV
ncbi:MAG TPA: endo-1,3(4)-beta-glucanase [Clostridium sp.]|nr:endo-1,3(4)-beta-glucanase [Clostridium sp.]